MILQKKHTQRRGGSRGGGGRAGDRGGVAGAKSPAAAPGGLGTIDPRKRGRFGLLSLMRWRCHPDARPIAVSRSGTSQVPPSRNRAGWLCGKGSCWPECTTPPHPALEVAVGAVSAVYFLYAVPISARPKRGNGGACLQSASALSARDVEFKREGRPNAVCRIVST